MTSFWRSGGNDEGGTISYLQYSGIAGLRHALDTVPRGNACGLVFFLLCHRQRAPARSSLTWVRAGGNDVNAGSAYARQASSRPARPVLLNGRRARGRGQATGGNLADEMRRRPGARRGAAVFAWVAMYQCDEVPDRLDRQRWMHREHARRGDRNRDRVESL